jgi:predicted aspartyl protease
MRTVTSFDTSRHHIYVDFTVTNKSGNPYELSGVVDTGAPWTELNDAFLAHAGFIVSPDDEIPLKPGLETQKYAKILLPSIAICGQILDDFQVMVSRFDPAWGIAALIGLDFFRRFSVTIDYGQGVLVCEPL